MYALIYTIGSTIVLIGGIIFAIRGDGKLTFSGLSDIILASIFSIVTIALFLLFWIIYIVQEITIWKKKD